MGGGPAGESARSASVAGARQPVAAALGATETSRSASTADRWTLFRSRASCLWATRPMSCNAPTKCRATLVKVRTGVCGAAAEAGRAEDHGRFVQRVTLEGGPYMVVLDQPAAVVKVPVGRYRQAKVCLKKGDAAGVSRWAVAAAAGHITVGEKAPAVLTVGGPLTNSVVHQPPGEESGVELPVGRGGRGVSNGQPGPLASAGVYGVSGRQEGWVGQVRVWVRQHLLGTHGEYLLRRRAS